MPDEIGFIGLGNMGLPMARNLREAGYDVLGFDVDEDRMAAFERAGGRTAANARTAAGREVVVTMVRTPDQLHAVADYLYDAMPAGAIHVDMSTVGPTTAESVAEAAAGADVRTVDAPVSGGVAGAEAATLAIMIGGDEGDVAAVRPVFDVLGEDVFHVGETGAGQTAKLCLQVLVGAEIVSICEAFAMGDAMDLDLGILYDVLTSSIGTSGMLEVKGRRIVEGDYEPTANIDLQHKDMQLVMDAAERFGLPVHATAAVTQTFVQARHEGLGDLDQFAVFELFAPAGTDPPA
jgi:3-hydroxyisobutyrate dehydrogenase-like beta-hydroxyacid dehydrogenase